MSTVPPSEHLVWVSGDLIKVLFRYDSTFVQECRGIEGRRWDGRCNTFPFSSAPIVRALAKKWGIPEAPEMSQFDLIAPESSLSPDEKDPQLWIEKKHVCVKFSYNPSMVFDIKAKVPGARWDGKARVWKAPLHSLDFAITFADHYGLRIEQPILDRFKEDDRKARELFELSGSLDGSPLNIPGLALPLRPYQSVAVEYLTRARRAIIADSMGLGKGHPVGTKILTPTGWTLIEDISVGDEIIGANGMSTRVTGVFPRGVLPVYNVGFNDGSSVKVDGDHLWAVKNPSLNSMSSAWKTIETKVLAKDIAYSNGNLKWRIPIVRPVNFETLDALPLDPYLLGVLLGDGGLSYPTPHLSNPEEFIIEEVKKRLPDSVELYHKGTYEYSIPKKDKWKHAPNPLGQILKFLKVNTLSHEKHIPEIYLRASVEDRLSLLRGLMDTDGNAGSDGTNEFVSTSKDLADGVADLVQGLGGIVRRSTKQPSTKNKKTPGPYKLAYRVNVKMGECPFLLPRKASAWKKPTKYLPNRVIKSIDPCGEAKVICLSVDATDQLYVTENYIVTHNTTTSISTIVHNQALPVVVVCKSKLKGVLEKDFLKFYPNLKTTILEGVKSKPVDDAEVIIVNYDIASARFDDIIEHGFKSLIVDESHYIKNGKKKSACPTCNTPLRANAVNCKHCGSRGITPVNRWTVKRTDAVIRLAHSLPEDALILLLTGTPINNRPGELIRQLECIDRLKVFGTEWEFKARYCPDNRTALNLEELHHRLRETCFIRRLTREVNTQLPPAQHIIEEMDIPDHLMDRYREVEADAVEYFAQKAKDRARDIGMSADHAYWNKRMQLERHEGMIRLSALRGVLSEVKKQAMIEWIEDFLEDSEEKIIVFGEHINLVEDLYHHFEHIAVKVRGDGTSEKAQQAQDSFQTDSNTWMFVGNIQATKEGFTLTASQYVVFCEFPWSPTDVDQCIGRSYGRSNDPHGTSAYYLVAPETIDMDAIMLLEQKRKVVDAVTDGVEYNPSGKSNIEDQIMDLLAKRGGAE